MGKKKEQKKRKGIEKVFWEISSNYNLTVDERASLMAQKLLEFGISEQHSGSLEKSLAAAMQVHHEATGAEIALNLLLRRTGNWTSNEYTDMLAILRMVRNSPLLKKVKDDSGDSGVQLYKDVEAFVNAINKARKK